MNLLELVPRDLAALKVEVNTVLTHFPKIDGFNIPDVLTLETRSADAAEALLTDNKGIVAVPHIRTQDLPAEETAARIGQLIRRGLTHVLIVSGDKPKDEKGPRHHVRPTDLIKLLKSYFPNLKVYGALDPYRQSVQKELRYAEEKLEAGADGLFTQPFFDIRLADMYLEQLTHTELFLGIAPVVTDKSRIYWETVNHVVFPAEFQLSLSYNGTLAKRLMKLTSQYGQNTYHMPIRVPIQAYLAEVF